MDAEAQERAHAIFDPIAQDLLLHDGVDLGPMFGVDGIRVRGKVFACVGYRGELMLKLPASRIDDLEAGGVGERVQMRGHPAREWMFVDAAHADIWEQLAAEALAFVDEITP